MAKRTIMICDRCKKEYKPLGSVKLKNRILHLIDYEEDLYDICPECYESLEKWFVNPERLSDDPEEAVCQGG